MLRIGMTNPPYILEHLKDIAKVLCHPCVYSFLHVPVQSGSDSVLTVSWKTIFCLQVSISSNFSSLFSVFEMLMRYTKVPKS